MDGDSPADRSNPDIEDFDVLGKSKSGMLPALQAQTSMSHTPFSVDDILDPTKFTGSKATHIRQQSTWHPWHQGAVLSGSDSDNDQDSIRGMTVYLILIICITNKYQKTIQQNTYFYSI